MDGGPARPRLRTKTGCLNCKARRKKCDETSPTCQRCASSGRQCQWPTSEDLTDRRYASHPRRRSWPTLASRTDGGEKAGRGGPAEAEGGADDAIRGGAPGRGSSLSLRTMVPLLSASASHQIVCRDLEPVISRHFVDQYFAFLLLPDCHPDFATGWIADIQQLMKQYTSLQYSALACAASHIHFIDDSRPMQELALVYYSKALRGLSEILAEASQIEDHNGLLITVILLYLHGSMGRGTYDDIPRHVSAAMRILRLRLLNRQLTISRPFDRLALESVLYQIFIVSTGTWSAPAAAFHFNAEFWLQAETLLEESTLFPGHSIRYNSPILGIPVALYRIVLSIKQLYSIPGPSDSAILKELTNELEEWEGAVLSGQEIDPFAAAEERSSYRPFYRDAAYLYILVASLLLEQLSESVPGRRIPQPAPKDAWQIRKATQILRNHQHHAAWASCFISSFPIYTLGYFLMNDDNIALVRHELERRWAMTKFAQLDRFLQDLDMTWTQRGHGSRTSVLR